MKNRNAHFTVVIDIRMPHFIGELDSRGRIRVLDREFHDCVEETTLAAEREMNGGEMA